MTESEVIKELQSQINICESMIFYNCDFEPKNDNTNLYKKIETAREAIKALEEAQEYRKLGTVEEVREAVEKTNEKKPILINYKKYIDKIENAEFLKDSYLCPNCKTVLRSGKYCNRCGQKIDWIGQRLESEK